jgi:putative phosphoribosyl transferase
MERPQGWTAQGERLFRDRLEAGAVVAERLAVYRHTDALVLGIPRGGVVVAAEVARRLGLELDIAVARKLGAPGMQELAIGAITPEGVRCVDEALVHSLAVTEEYLEAVATAQAREAERRQRVLRGDRPAPRVTNRVVIVVDDGLATGSTMRAAVRALRQKSPARLIVAVPVGSPEACARLADDVDEVVCPHAPEDFMAISPFYDHFEPVEDEEVRRILMERWTTHEGRVATKA